MAEIHYCTAVTLYFSGVVQGEQSAACESLSDKEVDGDGKGKKKRDKEFESVRSRVKNSKRQMETE